MGSVETLSTSDCAVAVDRLPFWNAVAARMVAPIRVEARDPAAFQARVTRRRCRELDLLALYSSPATIVSRPGLGPADALNLQLQLRGRSTNNTGGRSCELGVGDFTLYDLTRPLSLTFAEPTRALVVRLPLASAEDRLPRLRRMAGLKVSGRSGPGAPVSAFLRAVWAEIEHDECGWADTVDDVIWPMLDMAYAGQRTADHEPSPRDARRRAIFAAVERSLVDPDLDAAALAQEVGVSPRYVQMLFAEMGTTPSAYIRERRLDLAARWLAESGAAITEIAFDVGFNDLSRFCRTFRRRFDRSPRDYRAMRRG